MYESIEDSAVHTSLLSIGRIYRDVRRCITKVLFSFLFGNRVLGIINSHMRYEHNAYAYADNYVV